MKSATGGLAAHLFYKQGAVWADLYTITLSGGTVLRYTSAGQAVSHGGNTWLAGPTISDGGVKLRRGLAVTTLEIILGADGRTTVGGVPLLTFVRRNGLDGASVVVERLFLEYWGGPEIGSCIRFSGRFSEVLDSGRKQVTVMLASWTELLDANMPGEVYQASCLNTLFDTRCGVDRVTQTAAGVVGSSPTLLTLPSNLAVAAGTYNLGSILFTSGSCTGLRRTIRTQDGAGLLTLVSPLPVLPLAGDDFDAYPGCDLAMGTCSTKFANLANFRGQPFIPIPETAI